MDLLKIIIPPIHKEGYFFIFIFLLITLIVGHFIPWIGWIFSILTIWCVFFFRDPVRVTPQNDDLVISPADGIVTKIEQALPPKELKMAEEPLTRISIFLNVFNVHVNRVPATGRIKSLFYNPGKFFNASLDKASTHNERQSVLMETTSGQEIAFVQIAGLVARRIICDLEDNQNIRAGERFGIIRFGSRMDVYLPKGVAPLVIEGQTTIGGETVIANLTSDTELKGEIR
jgi:phosphatidylserine decarboxylase